MAAGFRCWTTSGATQIDGQYRNMALVSTGTVTLSSTDAGTCYADIVRTSGTPVIAWASSFPVTRSFSANGDFRLSANVEDVNKTVRYFIFDWPQLVTPSGSGLKVWSPGGVLVFDSNMKWFKVTAVVSTGAAGAVGAYNNYAARTFATCIASPAGNLTFSQLGGPDPQGNGTFVVNSEAQGTYVTPNGFGVSPVRYYRGSQIKATITPPPQGGSAGLGEVLLIDVTYY